MESAALVTSANDAARVFGGATSHAGNRWRCQTACRYETDLIGSDREAPGDYQGLVGGVPGSPTETLVAAGNLRYRLFNFTLRRLQPPRPNPIAAPLASCRAVFVIFPS